MGNIQLPPRVSLYRTSLDYYKLLLLLNLEIVVFPSRIQVFHVSHKRLFTGFKGLY